MNTALDDLEKQARTLLRLVGPRVSAAQDEDVSLKLCNTCTPPEKVYECFICTFACEERWRYSLHVKINPETCQRYAAKWAKNYAEQNS